MRSKIIAGNWKMNLSKQEAIQLVETIQNGFSAPNDNLRLLVFPPALYLDAIGSIASSVAVGAQNFYPAEQGAFTGEISVSQLKELGVSSVLVGHSERREIFLEDNEFVKAKVDAALKHQLNVTFCCGEPWEVREIDEQNDFVEAQLNASLFHLSTEQFQRITIAYEPIWAIGTGKTATAEQAEEMHAFIRSLIAKKYDSTVADSTSILYGGSCKPENAAELFSKPNVDGGLIGGASLKANDFLAIANAMPI